MKSLQIHDIEMLSFESLNLFDGIFNFVTTRNGGIEGNPYSSFNLGIHSGEDVDLVVKRQKALREALGIAPGNFFLPRQIHGNKVGVIDECFMRLSPEERKIAVSQSDALITNLPEVCIGITTADCVPVLMYDPVQKVTAAVHAGWKGTVGHIVGAAVKAMNTYFGTQPADIRAGIGPSIGKERFEVGDEVLEVFGNAYPDVEKLYSKHPVTGKYHIDLWEANRMDACNAGVPVNHIEIAGICTRTHDDLFFSARALGVKSGRFVSGICMR